MIPKPKTPEWWAAITTREPLIDHLPGTVIPGTCGYRQCSAEEYRSFPAVNASLLKARTAAEMFEGLTTESRDTDALTIGTLVHMACLEPSTSWAERFALADIPLNPRTEKPYGKDTKRGQEAWKLAALQHPGKIIVTEETMRDYLDTCRQLQQAMSCNPDAVQELSDTYSEVSGFLFHPRWQCWVKWRADIVPKHLRYIGDIKTTSRHVADFGKDCWQFGYFIQAAWYAEMHELLTSRMNMKVGKFTFMAVSKRDESKNPRPPMCRLYDVPMDPALCKGIEVAKRTLGLPEGIGRVDVFLDSLRSYVDAGCPENTPTNFKVIRKIWPAYESEAGERGRFVLAD